MKIGIMQPYFFPYIGYWQLINSVDIFVIYDNIQFTKKGWIKHNRIIVNGTEKMIGLTIKKDSDYLDVVDRYLSDDFDKEKIKILNIIKQNYSKSEYFNQIYPIIAEIIMYEEKNLFKYIYNSVIKICECLDIDTKIVVSSTVDIDHNLKGKDKVIAITKKLGGNTYINPIGGTELYDFEEFDNNDIKLEFIKANNVTYKQNAPEFIPFLSIIDVLMNNGIDRTKQLLDEYVIFDSKEKVKTLC